MGHGIRLALFSVVAVVVVRALASGLAAVDWSQVRFSPWMVGLSSISLAMSMVLLAEVNRTLLSAVTQPLPWLAVAEATWVSRLGRYIPGKVASVVGAGYMLRRYGVPGVLGSGVALLSTMLTVLVGLVLAGPLMFWEPIAQRVPLAWLWGLVLVLAGAVAAHPRVVLTLMNVLLRRLKRPELTVKLDLRHYVRPVVLLFVQWLLAGAALWLLAGSLVPLSPRLLPLMTGISAMAVTFGFLALFAPGGLGVREAIYLLLLSQVMDNHLAAVVTVAIRLLYVVMEVLMAGAGVGLCWVCRTRLAGSSR